MICSRLPELTYDSVHTHKYSMKADPKLCSRAFLVQSGIGKKNLAVGAPGRQ